jgi:hypothetical protein
MRGRFWALCDVVNRIQRSARRSVLRGEGGWALLCVKLHAGGWALLCEITRGRLGTVLCERPEHHHLLHQIVEIIGSHRIDTHAKESYPCATRLSMYRSRKIVSSHCLSSLRRSCSAAERAALPA